jgi:hypothetical protein
MSNIFRADNTCAHQISNGLLIGSVALLIPAPRLSVPRPAVLQSPDPYSTPNSPKWFVPFRLSTKFRAYLSHTWCTPHPSLFLFFLYLIT